MGEVLTLEEMKSRYDGEWVLVEEPEVDEHLRVVRGRVVVHNADRDELDREATKLRPKHSASLCFQEAAKGTAFVL